MRIGESSKVDDFNWDNFSIQLKDKYSRGDWFPTPRYLLALTEQGVLSKSEYIFLTLLISSDNFFTSSPFDICISASRSMTTFKSFPLHFYPFLALVFYHNYWYSLRGSGHIKNS